MKRKLNQHCCWVVLFGVEWHLFWINTCRTLGSLLPADDNVTLLAKSGIEPDGVNVLSMGQTATVSLRQIPPSLMQNRLQEHWVCQKAENLALYKSDQQQQLGCWDFGHHMSMAYKATEAVRIILLIHWWWGQQLMLLCQALFWFAATSQHCRPCWLLSLSRC